MEQPIILLPASVILQVFMIHLLCHLNGIAFPFDIKRETRQKGCDTLVRQTSLNKRLLFILPSLIECFLVKTLLPAYSDKGQTVVLCTKKDI